MILVVAVATGPGPCSGSGAMAAAAPRVSCRGAPALLGGLAGGAEPEADVGPGVAAKAEEEDGLGELLACFGDQRAEAGDGVNVALPDAAGVAADRAAQEVGVLVVFHRPPEAFGCHRA